MALRRLKAAELPKHRRTANQIYDLADKLVKQEEKFEHTVGVPQVTRDEWKGAMTKVRDLAKSIRADTGTSDVNYAKKHVSRKKPRG